jgi:hypothetical protein
MGGPAIGEQERELLEEPHVLTWFGIGGNL